MLNHPDDQQNMHYNNSWTNYDRGQPSQNAGNYVLVIN